MSSRTMNMSSLYNNNNNNNNNMSDFNTPTSRTSSRITSTRQQFVAAGAAAEDDKNSSKNTPTSTSFILTKKHGSMKERSHRSSAVADKNRVPPDHHQQHHVDDTNHQEQQEEGANDLLMTAATALASFSGHIRESTPRRDGVPQLLPGSITSTTTTTTSTTPRTSKKSTGISTTHHHQLHPPPLPNDQQEIVSPLLPPHQQQLPLILPSFHHCDSTGATTTRPTNASTKSYYEIEDESQDGADGGSFNKNIVYSRRGGAGGDHGIERFTSKGQSRQKAKRFPVKLMHILSSGMHDHIICWTHDGLTFVVKKPSLLVSEVLPNYFKEVKYSSFTRKLHRWGFNKILRGKELSAYFHKDFRRGDYERCAQMTCSKNGIGSGALDAMSHVLLQKSLAPARKIREQIQQEKEQILQEQMMEEKYARDQMNRNNNISRFVDSDVVDHRYQPHSSAVFFAQPSFPVQRESMISTARPAYIQQQPQYFTGYPRLLPNGAFSSNYRFNNGSSFFPLPTTTIEDLQLEKARHSLEHRRIIDNAMNALKWEQARTSRGSHSNGQSNITVSHLSSVS